MRRRKKTSMHVKGGGRREMKTEGRGKIGGDGRKEGVEGGRRRRRG